RVVIGQADECLPQPGQIVGMDECPVVDAPPQDVYCSPAEEPLGTRRPAPDAKSRVPFDDRAWRTVGNEVEFRFRAVRIGTHGDSWRIHAKLSSCAGRPALPRAPSAGACGAAARTISGCVSKASIGTGR